MRRTALAALLAAPLLASAATLVQNGSFESNAQANGSWNIYSSVTGWTGTPNIELRDNVAGQAYDGLNFVELDTTANSGMFQDVATTAGSHYTLSFAYSARPNTGNTNDINVLWNGSLVSALGGSNATSVNNWSVFNFDVIGGAGATSRLVFNAAGLSDSYGGSLGAVAVTSRGPEPPTAGLLLAGARAPVFVGEPRQERRVPTCKERRRDRGGSGSPSAACSSSGPAGARA